jgi:hypothetical protein
MSNELGLRSMAFEVYDLQRPWTRWLQTATGSSAASASANTSGGWPTSVGRT